MKYFLYGYYGFGNFGDDLLFGTIVSRIREYDTEAEFIVRARKPISQFTHDQKIRFLLIEDILEQRKHSRTRRFLHYRNALIEAVINCDVMIIGGGTLFIDKGKLNWSLLFLYEAMRAAKRAKRRIIVTGVAIDILSHPLSLWLTRKIFSLAEFSAVRDALSLAYFQDWASPPKLSADLVWLRNWPLLKQTNRSKRTIGLNFIDYYQSTTQSDLMHEKYRIRLKNLIRHYYNQKDCDFHLIALQKGVGQRDDWFAEEFRSLIPNGQIVYIENERSLVDAMNGVDAIITTRFHLALLAAQHSIPTCIVDHELKLTSLTQELGLPSISLVEFVLSGNDPIERLDLWNADITCAAIDRLTNRAEVNFAWMHS